MKHRLINKSPILLSAVLLSLAGCNSTDLCYEPFHPHGQQVNVVNHWEAGAVKPSKGMRINLFALDGSQEFGVEDLPVEGGTLSLPHESRYMGISYDYHESEGVNFRNEDHNSACEAFIPAMVRATYSRAFPEENTVSEPVSFHIDKVESFDVPDSEESVIVDFYPKDVVKTYTFEVTRVRGAQHITDTRGAMSGISSSYFMTSGSLSPNPSTVLFDARVDATGERITGSFRTFGCVGSGQDFTIEILYPSQTNGIIQITWNVTPQVTSGSHIVVDADIDIIPDPGGDGSGFEADVNEWNDIVIPLPM